ncbi:MAG: hypothetical protein ACPG4Z_02025 [Chitinophagales bacterium]
MSKSKMTAKAAKRIQSAYAKTNRERVSKNSFATRAKKAAVRNKK